MYYKVVEDRHGVLKSCIMRLEYEETRYILSKWVWRRFVNGKKLGPLCVFDSLQAAEVFARRDVAVKFYECEIIPSKCSYIWGVIYSSTGREYDHISASQLPWGTVLADAVRLIKEV